MNSSHQKPRKHTRKQLLWLTISNKETHKKKTRNNQSKMSDVRISDVDYKMILFTTFTQIKEKLKNMSRNERL